MGAHSPTPSPPLSATGVLRRNGLLLAMVNTITAAGITFADPGASPSLAFLAFLAPLPVWGLGFAVAAGFQFADRPLIGHSIAGPLWMLLAFGAVLGLLAGRSTAPAASIVLTGLELYAAGHHLNAMHYRRQEREAARSDR